MRKTWSVTFTLALFLLAAVPGESGMLIAVSIEPQKYFVEKIGKGHVDVMVLVGAGEDPHTYEPGPRQMERLSSARAWFTIGIEFEQVWLPRFQRLNPSMTLISTGSKPEMHTGRGHESGHAHAHSHEGMDPHIWTSPPEALEMAGKMLDGLIEIDPTNAASYRKNFQALSIEVQALDAYIKDMFSAVPEGRRVFMVYHPAWGHFASAYGLEQIAVEQESQEPSPAELAAIIEKAGSKGVSVVFVKPRASMRASRAIAKEIGARVETIDPLAEDWERNLREVAKKICGSMTQGGGK